MTNFIRTKFGKHHINEKFVCVLSESYMRRRGPSATAICKVSVTQFTVTENF